MPSADRLLYSTLHDGAMDAARRPEIAPIIAGLARAARRRDDIRTECAGVIAGCWWARPGTSYPHELTAAGLLLAVGPVDVDELRRWIRVGQERMLFRYTAS